MKPLRLTDHWKTEIELTADEVTLLLNQQPPTPEEYAEETGIPEEDYPGVKHFFEQYQEGTLQLAHEEEELEERARNGESLTYRLESSTNKNEFSQIEQGTARPQDDMYSKLVGVAL